MKNKRNFKVIVSLIAVIALMISVLSIYASTSIAKSRIKSKSVSLNSSSVTMGVGDIVMLSAKMKPTNSTDALSWSSSDKSVASVSKTGVVTGKKEGTAKITVKTTSKKSAVCTVKIKAYLTKKEALALMQSNLLSEESIRSMIEKNTLSKQDVLNLIRDNTLSEDRVIALINERVVSAEQIKQLINENSGDFKDGDEVTRWEKQALPYQDQEGTVTINDISIKKYHCEEWNNTPQPHKFVITVKGSVSEAVANSLEAYSSIELRLKYYSDTGIEPDGRYYNLYINPSFIQSNLNKPDGNVELKKCEIKPNGEFEVVYEQYNINAAYNHYYIWETYLWKDF